MPMNDMGMEAQPMGDVNNEPIGGMGDDEPMDDPQMNDDSEGFDAGVDVDKDEDPKKYIQQLSGKLSQELRNYNQEQEKPDTELNKYVAGMIIPQASKDMTDKEKKEIISKIEKGSVDSDDDIEQDEDLPSDEGEDMNMGDIDNDMKVESKSNLDKIISEIINSTISDNRKEKKERQEKKKTYKDKHKNPFSTDF